MSSIPDGLKQAAQLFAQKDLIGAQATAERTLEAHPNHPVLLQLLGVIYSQSGDSAKGIATLRRALKLMPSHVQTRLNLAKALLDTGALQEAAEMTDPKVVLKEADTAEFWRIRGDILKASNDRDAAIRAYERAVELKPDSFEAWTNLGNTRRAAGDRNGSVEALVRAVQLRSDSLMAQLNLAKALNAAGRTREGIDILSAAEIGAPDNAELLLELGVYHDRLNQTPQALIALERAARLAPGNADVHFALGQALSKTHDTGRATASFRRGLALRPGDVWAYQNFGALLEQMNQLDAAEQLLREAEGFGVAARDLALLRARVLQRQGRAAEALPIAESAPAETGAARAMRAHAIGELKDRLGDYDGAFAAFDEMNRLLAAEPAAEGFTGGAFRERIEAAQALTTRTWVSSWQPARVDTSTPPPVFLVGFPRSGTTLLDTVLMGHPGTHVLEEEALIQHLRNDLGRNLEPLQHLDTLRINAMRRRYFELLNETSPPPPGALVIDKLPMHIANIPLIRRIFPDAKFIFAERHPCDAVLSCFMQNFVINAAMASFLDLKDSALLYDRLIGYWFQCREVFGLATQTVRYESLVEDVEAEVRPLIDFLGLEWTDAVLDNQATAARRTAIRTPSYAQVTERVHTRARGRWTNYRAHMAPVLPILAPWAERLGYSMDD